MSIKVLLIDDNVLAQKFTLIILKPYQCEVDIAVDGAQALSLLAEKKYDMLFVDYGLPDIKGPQLSQKIREMEGCETVPIIALSAHSPQVFEVNYEQECLEAGMDCYITKPLQEEQAVELLKKYVTDKIG